MTIDLYYMLPSAPCRSVMLTAKAVGVELNLIECDLAKGEQLAPGFIKMNPQHTIPVLNDNGFVLTESRAICCYLVDQYGKDDSLYPKDPKKRALVNQRLYFDMGTLYQRFLDYYISIMWLGQEPDPTKYTRLEDGFQFLDKFLEGKKWVAGDNLTIADIDILTTVSSCMTFGFSVKSYPNITKWFANVKSTVLGYEEIDEAGCVEYKKIWDELTNKRTL